MTQLTHYGSFFSLCIIQLKDTYASSWLVELYSIEWSRKMSVFFKANSRSLFSWLGTLDGVKGQTSDFLQRQTWHANFKCGALCKI